MNRPPPNRGDPASDGYHYEAVVDTGWRLYAFRDERRLRRCRGERWCAETPVAVFARPYTRYGKPGLADRAAGIQRTRDYAYCAEHMYGRWIENGQVMTWILRKDIDEQQDPAAPTASDRAAD